MIYKFSYIPESITLVVIITLIALLIRDVFRPVLLFLGALAVLLFFGIISPAQAFSGFSNTAVFTVGALFIVAAAVQHTGALDEAAKWLLPADKSTTTVVARLTSFTSFTSAFLNNTPIVAMLIPQIQRWSQKTGISSSKIFIPLSYAAIIGGIVTLIGTSTNLIVSGMLEERGYEPFRFFELTWIGLPAAVLVFLYMSLFMHRMLPEYQTTKTEDNEDKYQYDLQIPQNTGFHGKTLLECGLRDLKIAYVAHIKRAGHIIGPVGPSFRVQHGDKLTFIGNPRYQDILIRDYGLSRAVPELQEQDTDINLPIFQAVVASSSRLVGKSLKQTNFREQFRGVVVAIQRKEELIQESLGHMKIQAGDLLLIEAKQGFDKLWNSEKGDFYLVVKKGDALTTDVSKAPIVLGITAVMILLAAFNIVPIVIASMGAAILLILLRCLPETKVIKEANLPILTVIAAALGIGQALEASGLAAIISNFLLLIATGYGIITVIALVYLVTNILTEVITNNAAAALMVPTAIIMASEMNLDPHALTIPVAVAASASFLSPYGYQTNLMVMGPGKYKFIDFTKAGLPISILLFVITTCIVYLKWT